MERESIVYGYIRCLQANDRAGARRRYLTNKSVISALPEREGWPLIWRDFFSMPNQFHAGDEDYSHIIHFGGAYNGVEYEWEQWTEDFEAILRKLYWTTAIVHLETELSGKHTFSWETRGVYHEPQDASLDVHCQWEREATMNAEF